MTPALGSAMPPRTRSSDVLPAPLRPTRPTLSPARTVKPAPSTTRVPPISTVSPRTDNMVDHGGSRDRRFHHAFHDGSMAMGPPVTVVAGATASTHGDPVGPLSRTARRG